MVFPPFNEDYGFVTVEAFMCGKPVITCHDSGGPSELVRDGENGYVTAPTPEALAAAMRTLMDDRNLADADGRSRRARLAAAMTWPDAVQTAVGLTRGSTAVTIMTRLYAAAS